MNLSNLTAAVLNQAADIKEKIEVLTKELSVVLGDFATSVVEAPAAKPAGRRQMSASARAKIAAAQRARWAKQKGGVTKAPLVAKEASKPAKKRKMSAAGRARIIAAQKARWAKVKAAKKA